MTTGPRERRASWIRIALLGVLAAAALSVVVGLRWSEVSAQLAALQPGWLAVAAALNLAMLPFTAGMWNALLPPADRVGLGPMLRICAVKSLVANTLPVTGLGHAWAVWLLVRSRGVRWAAALSAIVVLDTLLQGLGKALLLALAASWAHRSGTGLRAALRNRLLEPLAEALREVPRIGALVLGITAVLAKFALQWAALMAAQRALGLEPSARASLAVVTAVSLATSFALTPGNLGTYQAAAVAAYALCNAFPEHALALSLLHHFALLLPACAAGLFVLAISDRGLAPRSALAPRGS